MKKIFLTPKLQETLDFIESYARGHSYAPSYAEIKNHFHLRSLSPVHYRVYRLKSLGLLGRVKGIPRGIELFKDARPRSER